MTSKSSIYDIIKESLDCLDSGSVTMEHPNRKPYTIYHRPFTPDTFEDNYTKEVSFSESRLNKEDNYSGFPGVLVHWYEDDGTDKEIVLFDIELYRKYREIRDILQNN